MLEGRANSSEIYPFYNLNVTQTNEFLTSHDGSLEDCFHCCYSRRENWMFDLNEDLLKSDRS